MTYFKQKPGSIEEVIAKQQSQYQDPNYKAKFDEALKDSIRGIGQMTPKEKSEFFNKLDAVKKEDAKKVQKKNVDTKREQKEEWKPSNGKHADESLMKDFIDKGGKVEKIPEGKTAYIGNKIKPHLANERNLERQKQMTEETISERGGANTSSRQGSFAKSRKPKYRFGYRVAEKEPEGGKKLKEIRIRPKRAVESDLTKSQVKKVHKKADELPKKSFRDQYGKKKGDSVRYAVATNQTKKKLGIENKNHPAKKKWETLVAKKAKKESDNNTDILPKSQEPTQKTDPMNIQTKEPEKKKTDNGTKSDKIDVNPRIDYHA